ncbi:hypothetical protein M378DRAFT_579109 [Amanita muscaria Koide BX008]|uniref:Uncharacterized protein n=1 Tax=Amanita muscaria (strain Koide BX008) TaxID=946122 RepID=A0A0C2SMY8_AMAMK|nr:hypothetical protein M378DRAFT_579109 [Amanita muscaria Koide BX008]
MVRLLHSMYGSEASHRAQRSPLSLGLELWYVVTRIIPEFATFLVGVNNNRQFVVFLTSLVIGIVLSDYLTYAYFSTVALPVDPSQISTSCPLPADLCAMTTKDTFLVSVAFWLTLQLASDSSSPSNDDS